MMSINNSLHIYEKIFLLALRDKEGVPFATVNYQHAVAGAVVAGLMIKNIVGVETVKRNKYLQLINAEPTGDELLDECIAKLAKAKRRAQVRTWVQRFSNLPGMKNRIARQLCRKNILKEEEDKILFIFRHHKYPEVDPRPEKQIIAKLEKAIFGNSSKVDPETAVLISICKSAGLLNKLFERKRLKGKKQRIKKLIEGELIGQATKEAIESMHAAVMVAAIVPGVTSAGH